MQRFSGPAPGQAIELDEADHQALDLLDSLPYGAQWRAEPGDSATHAAILAEVQALGEPAEAFDAALARARSALTRIVADIAAVVVEAAGHLATTEDRGQLDPESIAELRQRLEDRPEAALALAWAIELAHELLGFDPDNLPSALLDQLGADADEAGFGAGMEAVSSSIAERLGTARAGTPSQALRVFRSAAVSMGGPSLRATSLATEHPEHIALARQVAAHHRDPLELVQAWDQALASIDGPPTDPLELIDGPKRKFTIVHAILALTVLGLTLWHYLWR